MPQILVLTDAGRQPGEDAVMLRERVTVADLESDHFATQLVERLGWAVGDATELEREAAVPQARDEDGADADARERTGYERSARVVTTAS